MHNEDEKIIDLLKKMPYVEDDVNKEDRYRQLSMHFQNDSSIKRKQRSMYFIATAAIIFIAATFSIYFSSDQLATHQDDHTDEADDQEQAELFTAESSEMAEDAADVEEQLEIKLVDTRSRVIHELPDGQQLIHFAAYDETGKYIVPFVQMIPSDAKKKEHYMQLDELIGSNEWLHVNFNISEIDWDTKRNQLFISLEVDENTIPEIAEVQPILNEMFAHEGVEIIFVEYETSDGTVGTHEFKVGDPTKASYLLYHGHFFIMVPHKEESTIHDALLTLQDPIDHPAIENTLDSTLEYRVRDLDERLILEFDEGTVQKEDVTEHMIESILLTAKSYGYTEVLFVGMPLDHLGSYQFHSAIPVPLAANPY